MRNSNNCHEGSSDSDVGKAVSVGVDSDDLIFSTGGNNLTHISNAPARALHTPLPAT